MRLRKPVVAAMDVGSGRASVALGSGMDCDFQRLLDVLGRGSREEERDSSADTAACGGRRNTAGNLVDRAACARKMELSGGLEDIRDKRRAVACEALRELPPVRLGDATPRHSAAEWEIPGCAGSDRGRLQSAGSELLLVELHAFQSWPGVDGQPMRVQWSWVQESKCPLAEVPSRMPSSKRLRAAELPSSHCHSPALALRCPSKRCSLPFPASAAAEKRSSRSTCCHPSRWPV